MKFTPLEPLIDERWQPVLDGFQALIAEHDEYYKQRRAKLEADNAHTAIESLDLPKKREALRQDWLRWRRLLERELINARMAAERPRFLVTPESEEDRARFLTLLNNP